MLYEQIKYFTQESINVFNDNKNLKSCRPFINTESTEYNSNMLEDLISTMQKLRHAHYLPFVAE